jgi:hypothetical protein
MQEKMLVEWLECGQYTTEITYTYRTAAEVGNLYNIHISYLDAIPL